MIEKDDPAAQVANTEGVTSILAGLESSSDNQHIHIVRFWFLLEPSDNERKQLFEPPDLQRSGNLCSSKVFQFMLCNYKQDTAMGRGHRKLYASVNE